MGRENKYDLRLAPSAIALTSVSTGGTECINDLPDEEEATQVVTETARTFESIVIIRTEVN